MHESGRIRRPVLRQRAREGTEEEAAVASSPLQREREHVQDPLSAWMFGCLVS